MQSNITLGDRYFRLTAGLLMFGCGAGMRGSSTGKTIMLSLGAMKIAEGITGWCPLMQACGVRSTENAGQASHQKSNQQTQGPGTEASVSSRTGFTSGGADSGNTASQNSGSSKASGITQAGNQPQDQKQQDNNRQNQNGQNQNHQDSTAQVERELTQSYQ